MFSSLTTKKWGRTCRVAAVFRDEEVNPTLLRQAVADVLPRYPNFSSRMRHGAFWYYLEQTDAPPEIREECGGKILPITFDDRGRPNFRIVYYKRRVAIECAHVLADGMGILTFFTAILRRYAELTGDSFSDTPPPADPGEQTNAFADCYRRAGESHRRKAPQAYHLPQVYEKEYLQLIFALMPTEQVKRLADAQRLTVTEYLAAVLIQAVLRTAEGPIRKTVSIAVPVNLRRFFPTKSVRNFTIQSFIYFKPEGNNERSLHEICDAVRGQLQNQLTLANLQSILNHYGKLTENPVLKIVPNILKQPVLRHEQKAAHDTVTTILTNLGCFSLPAPLDERIERIDAVNGDTSKYGLSTSCSCLSYNGFLNLCFSMCNRDTRWCRTCIQILTENGVDVRIESTHGNGEMTQ